MAQARIPAGRGKTTHSPAEQFIRAHLRRVAAMLRDAVQDERRAEDGERT
jgi:hypothetical protein